MENQIQNIEKLLDIQLNKYDYNSKNQTNTYSTWTHLEGIKELCLENISIDDINVLLPFSKKLHTLKLINCSIDNIQAIFDFEDLTNLTLDKVTINEKFLATNQCTKPYNGNLIAITLKNMMITHLKLLLSMAKNLTSVYIANCTIYNFYKINLFPKLNNLTLDNVEIVKTEQDICYPVVPNRNFWFLYVKNMKVDTVSYFIPISETITNIDLINCEIGSIKELYKFPVLECLTIDALTTIHEVEIATINTSSKAIECVIEEYEEETTTKKTFDLGKLKPIANYIQKLTFKNNNISNINYLKNFTVLEALKFERITVNLKDFLTISKQISFLDFVESNIKNRSQIQYFKNLGVLKIDADTEKQSFKDFKTLLPLKNHLKKFDFWEFSDSNIKNLASIKQFTALESVFILYASKKIAKSVFSLPSLKKLSINIKTKKTETFNVKTLKNIEELYIESENHITIKGLKNIKHLKVLSLKDSCNANNIHKIKNLQYLKINEAIDINKLPKIDTLTKLKIDVTDEDYAITGLEKFINLKELLIEGTNKIKLGYLPNLKILDISSTFPEEIDFLDKLPNLEKLSLENNCLTEVKGLDKLINLKMLNLSDNKIQDISELADLKSLELLNLHGNKISNINILNTLSHLKQVNLSDNSLENKKLLKQLNKPEIAVFYGISRVPFRIWKDQDFKL